MSLLCARVETTAAKNRSRRAMGELSAVRRDITQSGPGLGRTPPVLEQLNTGTRPAYGRHARLQEGLHNE